MSPDGRRVRRGFLHAAWAFVTDLPSLVAGRPPTRARSGRGPEREWTWPRRIAVVIIGLGIAGAAAAWALHVVIAPGATPPVSQLHTEALEDVRARRFDAAAAKFRAILALTPSDARARYDLGASLLELGRRDEGLREIRLAASAQPDLQEAHLVLAQEALLHRDDDAALAELRLVVATPPASGVAESLLAGILRRRGRDAEAMPHLAAATKDPLADPLMRVRAGLELGRIHGLRAIVPAVAARERQMELSAYAAAKATADGALTTPGTEAAAALRASRAALLLAMGRPREALVDADIAVAATSDPSDRAALRFLRAQVYSLAGDSAEADKELAEVLAAPTAPPASAFRGAAAICAGNGDTPRALDFLARAVAAHPDDAETGLLRATILFQTGDADGARAECARVAAADPRETAAVVLAGDIRRARDDLDGAREMYALALARRPGDADVRLRLAGTALSETGEKSADAAARLDELARIANDALAAWPGDPAARLALAKVLLAKSPGRDAPGRKGDTLNTQARKLLIESVEGDPLSVEAWTFLGWAWYLSGDAREASAQLQQVLALVPGERPRLRLLYAACLRDGGAFREAAAEASRACAALPDSADAWNLLAKCARDARDRDGTLRALRRLQEIEPANLQHLFAEAAELADAGRFTEAEARFAVADERARAVADPAARAAAEMSVASARAALCVLCGKAGEAKGILGAIVDRNPSNAAPYVRYARFLEKLGQDADAERELQRALAVEPGSLEARRALCEIWFARGKVSSDLVNAQVAEVSRIAPKDPLVDYLRGRIATLEGDVRLGAEVLARYADARPDDPDGRYALGVALAKGGRYDEAIGHFEATGRLVPGSPEVRVALTNVGRAAALEMLRRGSLVDAQSTLRRLVADDPSSREARALRVEPLRALGDAALSEKEARALLLADPSDRPALRMLASLEVQSGRLGDAAATLRRLTDAAPEDWTAWQSLSAVLAEKGDEGGAGVAAKAARQAAPDEPGALVPTLRVLVRRGDLEGAEKEIAAAAARHPGESRYPLYLAMLRERQGRHEDAVAAASSALDLKPAMPAALSIAIEAIASGLSDPTRAAAFARERVAKAKDDESMTCQLAALEADLGHRDAALALLASLCGKEMPLPQSLSQRGPLVLESRDFAAARKVLSQGAEK